MHRRRAPLSLALDIKQQILEIAITVVGALPGLGSLF